MFDLRSQNFQELGQPVRMCWPRGGGDKIAIDYGFGNGNFCIFAAGPEYVGAASGVCGAAFAFEYACCS